MQEITHTASPVFKSAHAESEVLNRYKEHLRLWPVPNEQSYIPTRQGNTFVVASGPKSAPPIVLLHGTMSNAASWMREVVTWVKEFRVYAVDVIGDAGLSAPSRPSFASNAHALWLSDVLDGLDVPRASVIGTSMGGAIALDFAIRLPERVDSLVLICPGGVADKSIIRWALPLLLLGPWGARKVRERIIGKFPEPESDEAKKFAELTDLTFKSMVPRTENLPSFTDEQLARLTMPVFVLLGGRDVTMDSDVIKRRFERHIPHAEILLDLSARHYLGDRSAAIAQFLHRAYAADDAVE
ncbi:MAG TPA: alpha/beta hydrolase [Aggregatilinea sp.]|uniref:alpha/beta fold hydrolase n=1 Tax=Aggregatilinea sp. TaxID=2806333 RepID=UPI002BF70DEF|nr:alpha/beta hydrolase [Aggregatilinea sp.]HML21552.1 alpha/beta hydrolase [Aggregatilinea sp.]